VRAQGEREAEPRAFPKHTASSSRVRGSRPEENEIFGARCIS
jgi:hypothetical protein